MTVQTEPSGPSGAVKTVAAAALVVAGCAACCAPLIAAPALGLLSAAGVGLALAGKIGLGLVALTGMGVYLFRKRRILARQDCQCAPDSGCNAADSCAVPTPKSDLRLPC